MKQHCLFIKRQYNPITWLAPIKALLITGGWRERLICPPALVKRPLTGPLTHVKIVPKNITSSEKYSNISHLDLSAIYVFSHA